MDRQISKTEFDETKKAIGDAERGHPSLVALARAHEICARAGAEKSLVIVDSHIEKLTSPVSGKKFFLRSVFAGIIAGTIVQAVLVKRRK